MSLFKTESVDKTNTPSEFAEKTTATSGGWLADLYRKIVFEYAGKAGYLNTLSNNYSMTRLAGKLPKREIQSRINNTVKELNSGDMSFGVFAKGLVLLKATRIRITIDIQKSDNRYIQVVKEFNTRDFEEEFFNGNEHNDRIQFTDEKINR